MTVSSIVETISPETVKRFGPLETERLLPVSDMALRGCALAALAGSGRVLTCVIVTRSLQRFRKMRCLFLTSSMWRLWPNEGAAPNRPPALRLTASCSFTVSFPLHPRRRAVGELGCYASAWYH